MNDLKDSFKEGNVDNNQRKIYEENLNNPKRDDFDTNLKELEEILNIKGVDIKFVENENEINTLLTKYMYFKELRKKNQANLSNQNTKVNILKNEVVKNLNSYEKFKNDTINIVLDRDFLNNQQKSEFITLIRDNESSLLKNNKYNKTDYKGILTDLANSNVLVNNFNKEIKKKSKSFIEFENTPYSWKTRSSVNKDLEEKNLELKQYQEELIKKEEYLKQQEELIEFKKIELENHLKSIELKKEEEKKIKRKKKKEKLTKNLEQQLQLETSELKTLENELSKISSKESEIKVMFNDII